MTNPQVEQIRQMLAASALTQEPTLENMRTNLDAAGANFPPLPGVRYEPVDAGGVNAEWIRVEGADPKRTLMYVHGGGYMLGSLDSHRDLASRIAVAAKADTLAIDYPRAPEAPYPAALDHVRKALAWLREQGHDELGLVGESAGAGLIISATLAARDAGERLPKALACISPWVDLSCTSQSLATAGDPIMQPAVVAMMAAAYLGTTTPATDPGAAPIHADFEGMPPLLIHAGAAEGLLDDAKALAAKAKAAGVDVELEVWEDMFHAWHYFALMLDDAQKAIEGVGAYLRARV